MKQLVTCLFVLFALTVSAQNRIKASDIIKQINDGKAVQYNNVEIEGDLDLTDIASRDRKRTGNAFDHSETYESYVASSLSFTNCTFLGDVLAYYNIDRRDETYIAHFEKDVIFKNCVFQRASEFKYSEFNGTAQFDGTTFNNVANFKYAEFSGGPNFSKVKFDDGADFKYTDFPRGTSFEKATFRGHANFKYSKFKTPLNVTGVDFRGDEDFKYTRVDGRSFTSYLLSERD